MAIVNVSEEDFMTIAMAANRAKSDGDMDDARALDKIARKINAALTGASTGRQLAIALSGKRHVIRWQDMPSTIEDDRP